MGYWRITVCIVYDSEMCATSNMKNVHRLYDMFYLPLCQTMRSRGMATECDDSRLTNIVHCVRASWVECFVVYNLINVSLIYRA